MENKEELDVLLPGVEVKCGATTLLVQPFPFAKLPEVLGLVKSIGQSVYELLSKENAAKLHEDKEKAGQFSDAAMAKIADIVTLHFDEVVALLAIYCRVDKSVFLDEENGFSVEDGIALILTILAVHKRFFIQRAMPLLKNVKTR